MAHALGHLIRRFWRGSAAAFLGPRPPTLALDRCDRGRSRSQLAWCVTLVLLGIALPKSLLQAQTPGAPRTVRFTVFSARPVTDVAFTPRSNAAPLKLQFYPTARSPRYEYHGTMPLRFVDATSGALVAEASIPAAVQDALLLFTPIDAPVSQSSGSLRYQIAVLDDSAVRHGAGGLAIINLSGLALSGTINKEKLTLKAGLNPTMPIGRSAKVTLNTVFKNRTYQSYAGTVNLGTKERALLILFPPFYKGGLEVQSRLLLDQPPASAPVVR